MIERIKLLAASEETRKEDTPLNENRLGELTKQKLIEKVQAMTPEEQKVVASALSTEVLYQDLGERLAIQSECFNRVTNVVNSYTKEGCWA